MPCRYKMDLNGLEGYLEDLQKAGKDIDAAADRALIAGAEVPLQRMRELAPVGVVPDDPHPGWLLSVLGWFNRISDGHFHSIEVGVPHNAPAEVARYGNVQEYGSVHDPAQSYIRAGWDETKGKIRKAEIDSLKGEGLLP
jgi:hypothetical protein